MAGETPHSLRAGGAITLSAGGAGIEEVMATVGWRTKGTANYYLAWKKVMLNENGDTLKNLEKSARVYDDLDNLKGFTQLFP